ncbi:Armadillo repeat-containing kinesin-like protein 3 [Striga hermonthica]|uniref:Armadillo repeat-containing kinesin-like protein 3 n=1 Tax=Striga hermonthica TaxID=68872 RepID=A0A9N7R6F2_STRHE|nr:Armadillo repeat-containing kinesin-like protein 3 [Striga hermonthica]
MNAAQMRDAQMHGTPYHMMHLPQKRKNAAQMNAVQMRGTPKSGVDGRLHLPLETPIEPPSGNTGFRHHVANSDWQTTMESERVRVAVRLRPKNAEDMSDVDYGECVELKPELKMLKLRKNNWTCDSYRFDEVFTESASQKRVYEAVAKPVVESVMDGYNGTVMAYGQTGTGKTYTLGRLGKEDASERGIMVRALEDILSGTSTSDTVEVSYLQLYMESVQDLLAPEKTNIAIVEDAKTGEISVPGVDIVKIRSVDHFLQLLQTGEANRYAANTKMNTESSRSHAILMVNIRRSGHEKEERVIDLEQEIPTCRNGRNVPTIRKSKLLIVDLAGSERIDKSGSEGHLLEEAKFINLSLSSLGKCINALAENSPHIPTRDSKLTRLLRDSFGGSARTSLIITIGPSSRHHAETASTIMFGQRAMKVVNSVKVKEEFDYESLCRKLETQVNHLSAEVDRQQKLRENEKNETNKLLQEYENSSAEAEKHFATRSELLQKENYQLKSDMEKLLQELDSQKNCNKLLLDEIARLEVSANHSKILEEEKACLEMELNNIQKDLKWHKDQNNVVQNEIACLQMNLKQNKINGGKEIDELQLRLQEMQQLHEATANELRVLSINYKNLDSEKETIKYELDAVRKTLQIEERRRKDAEAELNNIIKAVPESEDGFEEKTSCMLENTIKRSSALSNAQTSLKYSRSRETVLSQRNTVTKICEEVGIQKILSLLESGDVDVQVHAVKVVANLAAEDINQEKIVQDGGLDALLMLLESSHNTTILRVASGAIANLAMNEMNQCLITNKGGAKLLANVASKTDDPQTLRMVAGAIANLCGNEKLHPSLKEDGAVKSLLGMARSGNSDVIAQVARGLANFSKCESRKIMQGTNKLFVNNSVNLAFLKKLNLNNLHSCTGHWKSRSLLMEDGALSWLVANLNTCSASTRRHMELTFCHLAQNEENAGDFITSGCLKELIGISNRSEREDIRNLAKKILRSIPLFRAELDTSQEFHLARCASPSCRPLWCCTFESLSSRTGGHHRNGVSSGTYLRLSEKSSSSRAWLRTATPARACRGV